MKPVDQEFLHKPEDGIQGDCFRACIASLLHLSLDEVPHFCEDPEKNDSGEWHKEFQEWLRARGYGFMDVSYAEAGLFEQINIVDCYHVLTGPSPRFSGSLHSVIGKNGVIVHDPHPDKTGLDGNTSDWMTGLIIKLC